MTAIKSGMERKSDEELALALESDDPKDADKAMAELRRRHQQRLERYMRSKLPADVVEDAIQETWIWHSPELVDR